MLYTSYLRPAILNLVFELKASQHLTEDKVHFCDRMIVAARIALNEL